ncbi:hypothetical protein EJ110_NYTH00413 [Nymphaea thermarum]|nr:hypothetical protein EJ110_NYTH00413 [Nymphaea thermarum]
MQRLLIGSISPNRLTGTVAARTRQSTDKVATEKKEAKQRRVVVTGMGVVTSLGHDPDTFYKNLLEGVSGISEIESFDCSGFPTRIAGEIKSFSPDGWVSPKISKRMDKFMLYMLTAGKKALIDGGLTEETMKNLDAAKCGVLIGSGIGGVQGWMGPNYSISTACATSNFCILNAYNHITQGEAVSLRLKNAYHFLYQFKKHSIPSDGLRAKARTGYISFSKKLITFQDVMLAGGSEGAVLPIGRGLILCMEKALTVTGVAREYVNYINAHGASTQVGDMREFKAMIKCFGQNPQPELRVNSTKSMIGHLLGAAGGVEAVATIQDAKLLVGTKKERLDIKVAMSNSFGFGGHSSSILFAPYKEIK